jgi:toxin-antitoxin system PIN domain toxin
MSSLSFPDVNVWLALLMEDHIHRAAAKAWWDTDQSDEIGFLRFTQITVLRLLTNRAAMNGKPLTIREAWAAYDHLFQDDRVALFDEPRGAETRFRQYTRSRSASPNLWADAWLLAFAEDSGGRIITFDKALAARSASCNLLT